MPHPATSPRADVALLTEQRYAAGAASPDDWYLKNILHDDQLLQNALKRIGLTSVRVDWADPEVNWSEFRCAVFRTTWDYFDRISEFTAWLGRVQFLTRLCNSPDLIWWNLDKHYLSDLTTRGVPVVPFRFIEPGDPQGLREMLEANGWREAVLKPCISGGARHTYRVNRDSANALQTMVRPQLAAEAFLLQPFLQDIIRTGEDTVMVINGQVTHAVRKVPKAGDFRVQDDHGGTVHFLEPTPEHVELALRAMAACRPNPCYGRVDMVRDDEGRLAVMELELIEPELWMRHHPPAADAFALAIAKCLAAPIPGQQATKRSSPKSDSISDDDRQEIVRIMSSLRCPKQFRCAQQDFSGLCEAEDFRLDDYVKCRVSDPLACSFAVTFGHDAFCQCPLRVFLMKRLKK